MGEEYSRPHGCTRRFALRLPVLGLPFLGLPMLRRPVLGVMAGATTALSTHAAAAPSLAPLAGPPPGAVVIRTRERKLYLVLGGGQAIRYPIAVARPDKQWHGTVHIDGKYVEPAWMPPPDVKRDNPRLPDYIAGGAPDNPMGARALTLSGDLYAIHGTTRRMRRSIGTYASYGCIRMFNEDIIDLYQRVRVGTPVIVIP